MALQNLFRSVELFVESEKQVRQTDLLYALSTHDTLKEFRSELISLYSLNANLNIFVATFKEDRGVETAKKFRSCLQAGEMLTNYYGQAFKLTAGKPKPPTVQVTLYLVNAEINTEPIKKYITEKNWGKIEDIEWQTHTHYRDVRNGYLNLHISNAKLYKIPRQIYVNGRKFMVKKPTPDELICTICKLNGHTKDQCKTDKNEINNPTVDSFAMLLNDFPELASTKTSHEDTLPSLESTTQRKRTESEKSDPIPIANRFECLQQENDPDLNTDKNNIQVTDEEPMTPTMKQNDEKNPESTDSKFTTAIEISPKSKENGEKQKRKKKNKRRQKTTVKRISTPHPKQKNLINHEAQIEIMDIASLFGDDSLPEHEKSDLPDSPTRHKPTKRSAAERSPELGMENETKFYKVYENREVNENIRDQSNNGDSWNETENNQDKNKDKKKETFNESL